MSTGTDKFTQRSRIADIADTQVGTMEVPRNSNSGEAIRHYQAATDLDGTGWPWCSAFVDWCVAKWQRDITLATSATPLFNRPRTAAAYGLINWAKVEAHNGVKLYLPLGGYEPERGDLVVYLFSHCGIVAGRVNTATVATVEGNTNVDGGRDGYMVAARTRPMTEVRYFIRLPA